MRAPAHPGYPGSEGRKTVVVVNLSGFTPDVKVWEVCFDKAGNFQDVHRAFELKGHTAGVHWFAFSADSHRLVAIATVSVSDA